MNEPTTAGNGDAGQALAPVSLLDDNELRKLLDAAERVKPKPTPPAAKDLVMEMYEVIGTLWEKGMTRKQMLAWLKKRGFVFKDYHLGLALRHYHDAKAGTKTL
jgi:protein involved in temperature-dependent protein secretion